MKVFYFKFIIMDYEKKYKEALERARIYRNNAKAVEEYSAVARYENIFPELHEEEKPLTPFQQCLNCILRGVYYAEVPDKKVNEFILNVVRTRTDELIKLAKRHEDTDCQFRENEDERIRQKLMWLLQQDICPFPEEEVAQMVAYLEKQKESKKEFHIPDYIGMAYYNPAPIKKKEQKPAEWSKEDEKMIDTIVSVLGQYIDYKAVSGTGTGYATPRYSKEIDWLKSLRPSWKPSEEQMDALKELIDDANKAGWVTPGATELYEQLKKL